MGTGGGITKKRKNNLSISMTIFLTEKKSRF